MEPTWDETEPVFEETAPVAATPEEISAARAFGLGGVKGGTFGFSDEMKGASDVLTEDSALASIPEPFRTAAAMNPAMLSSLISSLVADTATGKESTESVLEKYRRSRDEQRALEAQAAEQQPVATLGGEFVGGLLAPVPGAGAAKGAGLLAKMGAMAKTGAKAGAAYSAGMSEADLTQGDLGGLITDTAAGGTLGAIMGAGMQAVGSGVKSAAGGAGKIAKSFPLVQDTIDVFKRTAQGQELLGKVDEFSDVNRNLARELIDTLEEYRLEAGKLMQTSLDKPEIAGLKVKLTDIVKTMREKISQMAPVEENEIKDLDNFKSMLSKILKEEEKTTNRFIQEVPIPKATNLEKVETKVTKDTAKAQASDLIKREELQIALDEARAAGEGNLAAVLEARIAKLKNLTEYPPINILDETTGLPALGVPRGINKQPIVESISPQAEAKFQPLKLRSETTTVPVRTEASPAELGEILRSLTTSIDKSETHVGRKLGVDLKDQLSTGLETTLSESPQAAQANTAYQHAKGGVAKIGETQQKLGLPAYFGNDANAKVTAIGNLQRAVQQTQKPGSMGKQVLNEALDELAKLDPDMANTFKSRIGESSRAEYLARELAKESALSKDPTTLYASGKSVFLLGARGAGQAANAAKDRSKVILDLGTRLYDASPEQLQVVAERAAAEGKHFAPVLNKLLNAPLARRKALLFTLMQQPDFRAFMHSSEGEP